MRRVPAILLVLVFSFSLIAPALLADGGSDLPACCRRDGKHHCGMPAGDMEQAPASGEAVGPLHVKCPFFPSGGALLPHSEAALLTASCTSEVSIAFEIARLGPAECGYRSAFYGSHLNRGPPSLLS